MYSIPWYRDPVSVATIFVPGLWIILTFVVRQARNAPQTSGADLLGALIAFDTGVILTPQEFLKFTANPHVAAGLVPTHVVFLFLELCAWLIASFVVEPVLAQNIADRSSGWYAKRRNPYLFGLLSWGGCWALVWLHIANFRG